MLLKHGMSYETNISFLLIRVLENSCRFPFKLSFKTISKKLINLS